LRASLEKILHGSARKVQQSHTVMNLHIENKCLSKRLAVVVPVQTKFNMKKQFWQTLPVAAPPAL
jgi:hypothetical protein